MRNIKQKTKSSLQAVAEHLGVFAFLGGEVEAPDFQELLDETFEHYYSMHGREFEENEAGRILLKRSFVYTLNKRINKGTAPGNAETADLAMEIARGVSAGMKAPPDTHVEELPLWAVDIEMWKWRKPQATKELAVEVHLLLFFVTAAIAVFDQRLLERGTSITAKVQELQTLLAHRN